MLLSKRKQKILAVIMAITMMISIIPDYNAKADSVDYANTVDIMDITENTENGITLSQTTKTLSQGNAMIKLKGRVKLSESGYRVKLSLLHPDDFLEKTGRAYVKTKSDILINVNGTDITDFNFTISDGRQKVWFDFPLETEKENVITINWNKNTDYGDVNYFFDLSELILEQNLSDVNGSFYYNKGDNFSTDINEIDSLGNTMTVKEVRWNDTVLTKDADWFYNGTNFSLASDTIKAEYDTVQDNLNYQIYWGNDEGIIEKQNLNLAIDTAPFYNAVFYSTEENLSENVPYLQTQRLIEGSPVTSPETNPEKENFEFVGWKDYETSDKNIINFDSYTLRKDTNFMAVYRQVNYNVNYNYDNIEYSGTYNIYELKLKNEPQITREGYKFYGWRNSADNSVITNGELPADTTGDLYLTPVWKVNTDNSNLKITSQPQIVNGKKYYKDFYEVVSTLENTKLGLNKDVQNDFVRIKDNSNSHNFYISSENNVTSEAIPFEKDGTIDFKAPSMNITRDGNELDSVEETFREKEEKNITIEVEDNEHEDKFDGNTVSVSVDNEPSQIIPGENGKYKYSVSGLKNGEHHLKFIATDRVGHSTIDEYDIYLEYKLELSADGYTDGVKNETNYVSYKKGTKFEEYITPAIKDSEISDWEYQYQLDGSADKAIELDNGYLKINVAKLKDGSHTILVNAEKNNKVISKEIPFVVDTNGASIKGTELAKGYYLKDKESLSYSSEAVNGLKTVEYKITENDTEIKSYSEDVTGQISNDITIETDDLEDGTYLLTITVTDQFDVVTTKTETINVDYTAPVMESFMRSTDSVRNNYNMNPVNKNVELSMKVSDAGSGVKEVLYSSNANMSDSKKAVLNNDEATFTISAKNNETIDKYIYVRIVDKNDNIFNVKPIKFYIDTVLPEIKAASYSTQEWTNEDVILTVPMSDYTGIRSAVLENGDSKEELPIKDGNATAVIKKNGTYIIEVTDNAGNSARKQHLFNKIDKTAPIIKSLSKIEKPEWKAENETVSYNIEETQSGVTSLKWELKNKDNNVVAGNTLSINSNSSSFEIPNLTEYEDGEYLCTVTVTDLAGNVSEAKDILIQIDHEAPEFSFEMNGEYIDGNKIWFSKEQSASVKITDDFSGVDTQTLEVKINNSELEKSEYTINLKDKDADLEIKKEAFARLKDSDGKCEFAIRIRDKAKNLNTFSYVYYTDTVLPLITSKTIMDNEGNPLNERPYGLYTNKPVTVQISARDTLSGIMNIKLNETDIKKILTAGNLTQNVNDYIESYNLSKEDGKTYRNILEAEITDNVNNIYKENIFNNKEVMIETNAPSVSISKESNYRTVGTNTWVNDNMNYRLVEEDTESGIRNTVVTINGTVVLQKNNDNSNSKITSEDLQFGTQNIAVNSDGSFNIEVKTTDNSGNQTTTTDKLYLDNTRPQIVNYEFVGGNIEDNGYPSTEKKYGYYFNQDTQVRINCEDIGISGGLYSITYYLQDKEGNKGAETEVPLNGQTYIYVPITKGFKGQIYAKVTDNLGNQSSFVTPTGIVNENDNSNNVVISIPQTNYRDNDGINLYNTDVPVNMNVWDTSSGIRSIEYSVVSQNDSERNQSGVLTVNNDGVLSDTSWTINGTDQNLVTNVSKTITVSNNDNNIMIYVTLTDRSGNKKTGIINLSIDKTQPTIEVRYDNNNPDPEYPNIFKESRTATITVTERNFNENDIQTMIANSEGSAPIISSFETIQGTGNGDNTRHVATVVYQNDGKYTFSINGKDKSDNQITAVDYGNSVSPTDFIIDKTVPTLNIVYDNNSGIGGYYKASRTATIIVNEHNFNANRLTLNVSGQKNGAAISVPSESGFQTNGDQHTATVSFAADGDYTISASYNDNAGNPAVPVAPESFTVDQTSPTIQISGIMSNTAYNKETVGFSVSANDINLENLNTVLYRIDEKGNKETITLNGSDNGQTKEYSINNLEKDGVYHLSVTATDKAQNSTTTGSISDGNRTENTDTKDIIFSVNRNGSTYELDAETNEINGKYLTDGKDIVIYVTNVNEIDFRNAKLTLYRGSQAIELKYGKDYKVEAEDFGEWHRYKITVFAENFKKDGNYRITLLSTDTAGNTSLNNSESNNIDIAFTIDKVKPQCNIINLKNNHIYNANSRKVAFTVSDNIKLNKVVVKLNGKVIKELSEEELKNAEDVFEITVPSSKKAQNLEIIVTDAAGNEKVAKVSKFYITTSLWIRFINNGVYKLCAGISIAILLLLIATFIISKRSKKDKSKETEK